MTNETKRLPEEQSLWYVIALIMAAVGTLVIGYAVGITLEGNKAEETLEARQQQATNAVSTLNAEAAEAEANYLATVAQVNEDLATNEAQSQNDLATSEAQGELQLATSQAEATHAMATNQAEATQAIAESQRQATEAIQAVTETVGGQQRATESAHMTQTAIAEGYTPTPTSTGTPEIPQGEIAPISISVRLGPGEAYPVIDTISQETSVEILAFSDDGAWTEIRYQEEKTGFVPSESVRRTAGSLAGVPVAQGFPTLTYTPSHTPSFTPTRIPPSPTYTSTPTEPEAEVDSILATVYEGPGEAYPIIDVISQTTIVTVTGTSPDRQWLAIRYNGVSGFVRADVLRLRAGSVSGIEVASYPTLPPPTVPPTPSSPQAVASGQFIVVREGPGDVFPAIGVVSANDTLNITAISTDGGWFQVEYAAGVDGKGWISGEVIRVAGNFGSLPVVQGPPPPVVTTDGSSTANASASSSSAGSSGPVEPSDLPDDFNVDYTALGTEAYAYEIAVAINGIADGDTYESLVTLGVAQSPNTSQSTVSVDMSGAFLEQLGGEDLTFLSDFLPLTIGLSEERGYFYSENDDLCFDLGPDISIEDINQQFVALTDQINPLDFLDTLPENAVFGIVDENGLVGLPGVHYQLLGIEENGEIIPYEDAKVDLWWSADQTILYGYRITIVIGSDFYFLYQDTLEELDPGFTDVDTFEGTITLYLLPRAIDDAAIDLASPPAQCEGLLNP